MSDNNTRENWSGSLGFILAAAGSAIGLGNIWKFPYIVGQNGGGAFVLVYLICILLVGLPVMLCEIAIGRKTQLNPVGAFQKLMPKRSAISRLMSLGMIIVGVALLCFSQIGMGILCIGLGVSLFLFSWGVVGAMGVVAGFIILSFYSVVAGWTIGYMCLGIGGKLDNDPSKQTVERLAHMILNDARALDPKEKASIEARVKKQFSVQPKNAFKENRQVKTELEGATQTAVVNYMAKTFDVELKTPNDGMDKRQFETYFLATVPKLVNKEKMLERLAKVSGGTVEKTDSDGNVKTVYSKKLQTMIAGSQFSQFTDAPKYAIGFHLLFITLCVVIVCMGVQKGIERASKILMPGLLLLLLILIIRAVSLEGASAGISFLLKPDFSKITAESVLVALGHAFFTLSLGMGAMITYGSYLSKKENLFTASLAVVGLDTLIALMAGLAIFPAVFAAGFEPDTGLGLVFQTLPAVFNTIPGGAFWGVAFFLLLFVAALTSGVSLLEVVTAYFVDQWKWSRRKATILMGSVIAGIGVLCAVSIGDWDRVLWLERGITALFGGARASFFDILDNLGSNWLLPLGGLFISIFVGWIWGTKHAVDEIRSGSHNFADVHLTSLLAGLKDDPSHNSEVHVLTLASLWGIFIRFISPVAVTIAFLHAVGLL